MLLLISCYKCKTCYCWKLGIVYEHKNCEYGLFPSTKPLNFWEDYLIKEIGYDSVKCVMQ